MSSRTRHVKIFTGAPETASLDWQEEGLLSEFSPVFKSVLGLHNPKDHVVPKSTTAFSAWPKWRSIPASIKHLTSGPSKRKELANDAEDDGEVPETSLKPDHETSFLSTTSLYSDPADIEADTSLLDSSTIIKGSQALSQFLEHSFAVHNDLQSSQLIGPPRSTYANPHDEDTTLNNTILTETSFFTTTSQDYSFDSTTSITSKRKSNNCTLHTIPNNVRISNLKDIPNAAHLTSITPQTLTLNFIVGIISIGAPRTVKLRRGGRFMDVVEVLVADETKVGFSITFWLLPVDSQESRPASVKDELRNVLAALRPQDVVMIRDVALSSFRGQVFGQSLSRRITRNATKLDLLCREALFEDDMLELCERDLWACETNAGPYTAKTRRVRDWVLQFVGPGNAKTVRKRKVSGKGNKGRRTALAVEELPPDTQ